MGNIFILIYKNEYIQEYLSEFFDKLYSSGLYIYLQEVR